MTTPATCSRRSRAEPLRSRAAWDCFEEAASRYGLPRQVLSDNGLCFTGRLHGVQVEFERNLQELDVELINAGPYHPQTLGKLERFHKTLKLWLADEGPAENLAHLQELLDGFRHHYNTERPHQSIDNMTPIERFNHVDPVTEALAGAVCSGFDPNGEPVYPPRSIVRLVSTSGDLAFRNKVVNVGRRYARARVRVIEIGGLTHIYYAEELIRILQIDPRSHYQRRKGVPQLTSVT